MKKFITGRDLLAELGSSPVALLKYVTAGHQPYNSIGRPMPPPDVQKWKTLLDEVRKESASLGWTGSFEGLPSREEIKVKRFIGYKSGSDDYKKQGDEYYDNILRLNDLRDRIEFLKQRIESRGFSWEKYELPENEEEALAVINLLMDAYYEIDIKLDEDEGKVVPDVEKIIADQRAAGIPEEVIAVELYDKKKLSLLKIARQLGLAKDLNNSQIDAMKKRAQRAVDKGRKILESPKG